MNITFHLFQKFPAEPFEFLRSFKNSNLYVPIKFYKFYKISSESFSIHLAINSFIFLPFISSSSSRQWLVRHFNVPFINLAAIV